MTAALRVAVCDDSPSYAHALTHVLEADGRVHVVGTYATAEELLAALPSLEADLVTMDLELPGMDGVAAIERIMAGRPLPVVVVSAHTARGSRRAAAALAAGAVDVLHKGDLPLVDAGGTAGEDLRRRIRYLSRVPARVQRPTPPSGASRALVSRPLRRVGDVRAVGIASSTGGPGALRALLAELPAAPSLPFLVVQHMTRGFTGGLVEWLDGVVAAPVRLAEDGARATPGVWVAPDDAHLVLGDSLRLGLDRTTESGRHRPAADALFASMARCLGPAALVVVLTGMGRDGARGVEAVLEAGGAALTQDEGDAVLPGMPHQAGLAGAQAAGLPAEIGARLAALRGAAQ